MPITTFDSAIFRDAFGQPAMRAVFSDATMVAKCVAVEVALAKVQAKLGLIPDQAAADIARLTDAATIDLERLKAETDNVGYPIVGIVNQMAKQCGDAGRYLHWGATTQDIMDTATVLQLRDALQLVGLDLEAIAVALTALARKHRDTVMAGRTHLQHALPTTFGQKAAVWLLMIRRHQERLAQIKPRVLVVELGGAAGTLASLGDRGHDVQEALARELGLGFTPVPWHVARDGVAEAVGLLGLITGTLAKIATDVMLMMQTEVGEVFEPFVKGRGGSSTMPQKRNPISCELIIALGKIVRQHAGLMLDALVSDHERATGPWHLEWIAVPEGFVAASGALGQAKFMLSGLIVEAERMRRNLDITGGLIMAEAVMMALAPKLGRNDAHHVVYDACRRVSDKGTTLVAELKAAPEIKDKMTEAEIEALLEPKTYLGVAPQMVDRMLAWKG
jgi:3-carboxy-cis,cis-muconate cycloisomerase